MAVFIVTLLVLMAMAFFAIMMLAAIRGSRGPRYQGAAPHKGKVMRFTGMGSEVKEDDGVQKTTEV